MTDGIPHFDEDHDSRLLLEHVLRGTKDAGSQARFTCPIGRADVFIQRVRMRISRLRKKLRDQGDVVSRFNLKMSHTVDVEKMIDIATVWREQSRSQGVQETLDRMLQQKDSKDTTNDKADSEGNDGEQESSQRAQQSA